MSSAEKPPTPTTYQTGPTKEGTLPFVRRVCRHVQSIVLDERSLRTKRSLEGVVPLFFFTFFPRTPRISDSFICNDAICWQCVAVREVSEFPLIHQVAPLSAFLSLPLCLGQLNLLVGSFPRTTLLPTMNNYINRAVTLQP